VNNGVSVGLVCSNASVDAKARFAFPGSERPLERDVYEPIHSTGRRFVKSVSRVRKICGVTGHRFRITERLLNRITTMKPRATALRAKSALLSLLWGVRCSSTGKLPSPAGRRMRPAGGGWKWVGNRDRR
jgi:hypothetical protein